MISQEIKEQVKRMVDENTEGISLSEVHRKVPRTITRLQIRTLLRLLYMGSEISCQRVEVMRRKQTMYYPFNGQAPVTRKKNPRKENTGEILTMADFLPGGKYMPYLEP
jgi:hypothetical protein